MCFVARDGRYENTADGCCLRTAVPGPPVDVEASEVTKDSAVVTWKVPESDGGSPVTGYVVERSLAANARWLRVNKQPVCSLVRCCSVGIVLMIGILL